MNRFHVAGSLVFAVLCSCYVVDKPPQNGQGTAATAAPATAAPTATPTATAAPTNTVGTVPTTTPPPGGTIAIPGLPPPGGTTTPPPGGTGVPPAGGFTLPGVCIPIGSWSKQFDNGIPATGTVDIGTPVLFNQFPVNDGVVIATMPAGNLKGVGAMTSTNDLSVDVTNGAITVSYTCHFTGSNCNQGQCTVTKGGLSGFKLVKK